MEEEFVAAVKLTRAGQITIPKSLRNRLNLKIGDKLLVYRKGKNITLRQPP